MNRYFQFNKPIFSTMILSLIIFLSGCGKPQSEMTGEELFDEFCAGCHKSTGKGNFLLGVPANRGTKLSYWEIKLKIKRGSGGDSKMPVFNNLTDTEAGKIAEYLMFLK